MPFKSRLGVKIIVALKYKMVEKKNIEAVLNNEQHVSDVRLFKFVFFFISSYLFPFQQIKITITKNSNSCEKKEMLYFPQI